ncbi:MAG: hypothetical protein ACE5JX_22325, partial [Acidobacteriota bacterium]
SPDESLVRDLRWVLEEAGFVTSLSTSLEESFLAVRGSDPFLVLVDAEAMPAEIWEARAFLRWFQRRAPVLVLGNPFEGELEGDCQDCLRRPVDTDQLLSRVQKLHPH